MFVNQGKGEKLEDQNMCFFSNLIHAIYVLHSAKQAGIVT